MYSFNYHRAAGVSDAVARLAADPQAKLLAGGMTLLPSMKHRLAAPSQLVDVANLRELRGITREGDVLVVGAAAKHCEVADDRTVNEAIPALAALAASIGDPQVRARGTLGGSIANNDPAADYPAAVLGLDAVVVTDRRRLDAADFFQGMFATALEPDEIVCAVHFSCPKRAAYCKFAHPASGYAMAGVLVADYSESARGSDRDASRDTGPQADQDPIRVAVTGAGPGVFRWREAEAALAAKFSVASIAGLTLPAGDLNADLHAPAEYRAHLVRVMTLRAVARLTGESLRVSA